MNKGTQGFMTSIALRAAPGTFKRNLVNRFAKIWLTGSENGGVSLKDGKRGRTAGVH